MQRWLLGAGRWITITSPITLIYAVYCNVVVLYLHAVLPLAYCYYCYWEFWLGGRWYIHVREQSDDMDWNSAWCFPWSAINGRSDILWLEAPVSWRWLSLVSSRRPFSGMIIFVRYNGWWSSCSHEHWWIRCDRTGSVVNEICSFTIRMCLLVTCELAIAWNMVHWFWFI